MCVCGWEKTREKRRSVKPGSHTHTQPTFVPSYFFKSSTVNVDGRACAPTRRQTAASATSGSAFIIVVVTESRKRKVVRKMKVFLFFLCCFIHLPFACLDLFLPHLLLPLLASSPTPPPPHQLLVHVFGTLIYSKKKNKSSKAQRHLASERQLAKHAPV